MLFHQNGHKTLKLYIWKKTNWKKIEQVVEFEDGNATTHK